MRATRHITSECLCLGDNKHLIPCVRYSHSVVTPVGLWRAERRSLAWRDSVVVRPQHGSQTLRPVALPGSAVLTARRYRLQLPVSPPPAWPEPGFRFGRIRGPTVDRQLQRLPVFRTVSSSGAESPSRYRDTHPPVPPTIDGGPPLHEPGGA